MSQTPSTNYLPSLTNSSTSSYDPYASLHPDFHNYPQPSFPPPLPPIPLPTSNSTSQSVLNCLDHSCPTAKFSYYLSARVVFHFGLQPLDIQSYLT